MLSKIDITFVCLIVLAGASIFVQSLALSVALVCFTGLRGFALWQAQTKPVDLNEELKQELKEVKSFIAASSIKQAAAKPTEGRRFF